MEKRNNKLIKKFSYYLSFIYVFYLYSFFDEGSRKQQPDNQCEHFFLL